jgi:hypothetical protein
MFDIAVPGSEGALGVGSAWRQRMDTFCYRVTLHWRNILVLDAGERMSYISEKAKRLAGRIECRTDLSAAIRSVMEAGYWAASRYVPGEYSGGITLFRATEHPGWVTSDRMLGWEVWLRAVLRSTRHLATTRTWFGIPGPACSRCSLTMRWLRRKHEHPRFNAPTPRPIPSAPVVS